MSLESKIDELIAALNANTAALGGKAGATSTKTGDAGKGEKGDKGYTPKHTKEEMQAVMTEVREKCGMPKAKEIRDKVGKVEKISELTDPKVIDAVYEAGKAALAEKASAEEEV